MASKPRPYNLDELNKKIIAKPVKVYPESEMIGPFDRYRDQNRAIYEMKRSQFLNTASMYKRNNEMALLQNKIRLGRFVDDVLRYDFEEPIEPVGIVWMIRVMCNYIICFELERL